MIRKVTPDDIAILYRQQDDPIASEMADFPIRDRSAHEKHWEKILADDTVTARTIVAGGNVIGSIGSFPAHDHRDIGYWIGREYWGLGHGTQAVADFVMAMPARPLHAHVAEHNLGSLRVLGKSGFIVIGEQHNPGDSVKEIILRLGS